MIYRLRLHPVLELTLGHRLTAVGIAATLLAGCGGSQAPVGAPGVTPQGRAAANQFSWSEPASSSGYQIVYDFKGSPDGDGPDSALIAVNGTLYGTTSGGGKNGWGSVFAISASRKERVLYSFKGSPDGARPIAGLLDVDGTLYGTTSDGGSTASNCEFDGCGTVFALKPSGHEKVLYRFKGGSDGATPIAGLIEINSELYGATYGGGSSTCAPSSSGYYGCGVVYKVALSGEERILHRFEGVPDDGAAPWSSLLAVGEKLYGTASEGGATNDGVVYEISTSGKERVLYSFKGAPDGTYPTAPVITIGRKLYGTTYIGGSYGNSGGWGTAFKVSKTGNEERVIYSFGNSIGALPNAGVLPVNGRLYGTTDIGLGGTVYVMSRSGKARLLHHFAGPPDGDNPYGGLTLFNGALYGTTSGGGNCAAFNGCGTVFSILP